MTCAELRPHYAAYALGLADESERREIADHIRRRCVTCATGVRKARRRSHTIAPWVISVVLSVALIAVGVAGRRESGDTTTLQRGLSILGDPAAKDVAFGAGGTSPRGHVFASAGSGILLVASGLPRLAAGKTFELWVLAANGNAAAGGTFSSETNGTAVFLRSGALGNVAAGIEVTVEPDGGSAQPTTSAVIRANLR